MALGLEGCTWGSRWVRVGRDRNLAGPLTTAVKVVGLIGSGVGIILLFLALFLSTIGPSAPPVSGVAAILTLVSYLMGAIAAMKAPHWTLAASLTMLVAAVGVAMPLWSLMRDNGFLVMLLPAGSLFLGSIFTGLGFALNRQRQWSSDRIALVVPLAFAGILAAVLWSTNAQLERNIEAKRGSHSVQKFTGQGKFLARWGQYGAEDGQFWCPKGIAIDPLGRIYVVDKSDRVQVLDAKGAFVAKLSTYADAEGINDSIGYGQYGSTGIAVDQQGKIYVTNQLSNTVQVFSPSGRLLASWDRRGSEDGEFEGPMGVAVDSSGNVYVADSGNHRVQVFSADGKFLRKWGSKSFEDGMPGKPLRIAVDASGNVYVDTTQPTNYRGAPPPPRQPTLGC